MRHARSGKKLGRDSSHRRALYSNLAGALIQHGRIERNPHSERAVLARDSAESRLGARRDEQRIAPVEKLPIGRALRRERDDHARSGSGSRLDCELATIARAAEHDSVRLNGRTLRSGKVSDDRRESDSEPDDAFEPGGHAESYGTAPGSQRRSIG